MVSLLSKSSGPISSSFMHSLSSFAISSIAFLNGLLPILPLSVGDSDSCAVFYNCQNGEQAVLSCFLTIGLSLASFAQLLLNPVVSSANHGLEVSLVSSSVSLEEKTLHTYKSQFKPLGDLSPVRHCP